MDPKGESDQSITNESHSEDKSESETSQTSQLKKLNLEQFSAKPSQQPYPNQLPFQNFNNPMGMNFFNGGMQTFQMPMAMPVPMNFNMMLNQYQAPKNNYIKPFASLPDYSEPSKIKNTFASCSSFNDPSFDADGVKNAQFFILRSTNDDDLHKSIKYGIWASTHKNNQNLHHAFMNCRNNMTPIYFFFTVVSSEQYTGVAQMTSDVDFSKTFGYWWEESKWMGVFQVRWLFIKDINYDAFGHLHDRYGKPVIQMRDGTRLSFDNGSKMLKIFKEAQAESSIFDDFYFMDNREEKLRYSREMMSMMMKQMKQMGGGNTNEEEPKKEKVKDKGKKQFKSSYKGEERGYNNHNHGGNYKGRRQRYGGGRRRYQNQGNVYQKKDEKNDAPVYVNKRKEKKIENNHSGKKNTQKTGNQKTQEVEPAQILVKKKNKQKKNRKRRAKKKKNKGGEYENMYEKKSEYLEKVEKEKRQKRKKTIEEDDLEYEVKNAVVDLPPAEDN